MSYHHRLSMLQNQFSVGCIIGICKVSRLGYQEYWLSITLKILREPRNWQPTNSKLRWLTLWPLGDFLTKNWKYNFQMQFLLLIAYSFLLKCGACVDPKSTSVQVMAWCRQATSHYLSQCWQCWYNWHSLVTRPQWVKHDFIIKWIYIPYLRILWLENWASMCCVLELFMLRLVGWL